MSSGSGPSACVHLFYLEDTGVLFNEGTQELHLLNTSAALIWGLLEEGHDEASASAALADLCGLDPSHAAQFVAAATAQWRHERLPQGSVAPVTAPAIVPRASAADVSAPTWRKSQTVAVRRYRVLDSTFEVRYESAAQLETVHPVLAHLEDEISLPDTMVDVVQVTAGFVVYRDREAFDQAPTLAGVAPIVKSLLWVSAVNRYDFLLNIHAGVVGGATGCVLLPGSSGSGKSTLCALLVHAGYEFFSDEIALLTENTLTVVPVPLAICVKEAGIAPLAAAFPQLRTLPLHLRGDGKRVAYLVPPAAALPQDQSPRPVAALVFPNFAPGVATDLVPMPKAEALKRLLDECVVVRGRLDQEKVRALVKWVARTPCYRISFGSGAEAVEKIDAVLRSSCTTTTE